MSGLPGADYADDWAHNVSITMIFFLLRSECTVINIFSIFDYYQKISEMKYIYIYIYIDWSTERFFFLFLHTCYICVCFQLVAFVREYMWPKTLLMGYSMRLELTLVFSLNDLWLVRRVYIGVILPLS